MDEQRANTKLVTLIIMDGFGLAPPGLDSVQAV